jgi:hypothetical protein
MSANSSVDQDAEQKRRFWEKHIERWSQSGMRQVDYCRANGLVVHRFGYWKKRLERPEVDVSLIPVQLPEPLPVPVEKKSLNVFTPNGYKIEVNDDFDQAALRRLVCVIKCV